MPNNKWSEILVGVIIIGGLSWLAVQVYEMKGTVVFTADRVERISKVLPYVNVRIAQEEVNRSFQAAVISTKPVKLKAGEWASYVHVIDSSKPQRTTYVLRLSGPDDRKIACIVTGSVKQLDDKAVSFSQLVNWAFEINKKVKVPVFVDGASSFMLTDTSDKYIQILNDNLDAKPSTRQLRTRFNTWASLAKELDNNASNYVAANLSAKE